MNRMTLAVGVLALCASALGCGGRPDGATPNQSSMITMSRDGAGLFVADGDNGALVKIDLETGEQQQISIGKHPVRIARVGDRVWVTLQGERSIAELHDSETGLELVRKVEVGAEPYGIVASDDGRRVYVAISMEDKVLELDGDTMEPLRTFEVDGEPRWLVLNEPMGRLYVGTRHEAAVVTVQLDNGRTTSSSFPRIERGVVQDGRNELVVMTPRITGDPTLSQDGEHLAVPVVYVDHSSTSGSAAAPPTITGVGGGNLPVSNVGYYAMGPRFGLTRFNPAIVVFPVSLGGEPKALGAHALLVVGEADLDGSFDLDDVRQDLASSTSSAATAAFDSATSGAASRFTIVRSVLSTLRFSADGHIVYATLQGSESVVAFPREPVDVLGQSFGFGTQDPFTGISNFVTAPGFFVGTGAGPVGLTTGPDGELFTYAFLDRTVTEVPTKILEAGVEAHVLGATGGTFSSFKLRTAHHLPISSLSEEVQLGRRLFYAASNPSMSAEGAGVSCATCHADGRDDGLTWRFPAGPRQTPMLAGSVAHTAPYTWGEAVPTLVDEVMLTSQGRMLGVGLSEAEAEALTSFLGQMEVPDTPGKGMVGEAAVRGQLLFESAETSCSTCHTGPYFADDQGHEMYGMDAVNTPSLRGIAASAPYLHDGRATSLADVLAGADRGGMGSTKHLSKGELVDLEAYLLTL